MIKKEKYKREDGLCYTIPEMRFGDYEMREKLRELIKCKAIQLFCKVLYAKININYYI